MKTVMMEIGSDGAVRMLHDDAVDLTEFGKVSVNRASHVEWDNHAQHWQVRSAATGNVLACGFPDRASALTWEKLYYSPEGEGWKELKGVH